MKKDKKNPVVSISAFLLQFSLQLLGLKCPTVEKMD